MAEQVATVADYGMGLEEFLQMAEAVYDDKAARQRKWDLHYLGLAKKIAEECSKDPSTKTGAVIVDADGIVSTGYNGFAPGVHDTPERLNDRDTKIAMILHCEENAVVLGERSRLKGATLYTWPFMSCAKCAGLVIRAGIKRCVAPPVPADKADRWAKNMALAATQFAEAGVRVDIIEFPPVKEMATA